MTLPATTTCYRHPDRLTGLRCSDCGRPICATCSIDAPVGQVCPECSRQRGRQRIVRVRRGSVRASAPFTLAIVVITVAFYVISRVSLDLDEAFIERLAQINILVAEGEWWRLLTVVLLHGSAMHIFFNMWALWQLGPSVEALSGRLPFLTLYLAAAAGGGLLVYLLGNIDDVAIGSSGAIFGLFGVWLYNAYRRRETAFGRAILSQLGFLLLVNAMLPLFFPAISWQGHLGGLLTGILVSALWERRRTEASRAVAAGTVLVALLLLASPLSPLL